MSIRVQLAVLAIVLCAVSGAFADSIPFTVTTDFMTLAGQGEVIFGFASLSNTSSTDLFTESLNVNFVTGQGTFNQNDVTYGFSFPTLTANSTTGPGFLGLYIAPIGFSGVVTLNFDILTTPDFATAGPDYTATYTFNYPPVGVPEPGTLALLGSELAAGLAWLTIRRRKKRHS